MKKVIHLIGIAGRGMDWNVNLALDLGWDVQGSDVRGGLHLKKRGIKIFEQHDPKNVTGADLVVYSAAISGDNPEIVSAQAKGIQLLERAEALAMMLRDAKKSIIGVSGSYGKSTTTGMLASMILKANMDPFIGAGAVIPAISGYTYSGKGSLALIEACEYNRSFFHFGGQAAVVTGLEPEHLETYGTLDAVIGAFAQFANLQKEFVVLCADNDLIRKKLLHLVNVPVITYGLNYGYWRGVIQKNHSEGAHTVHIYQGQKFFGEFMVSAPGIHNVQNAIGAITMASLLGVKIDVIRNSLEEFPGVGGRFDRILEREDLALIHDYGHTPIEISATIKTLREVYPQSNIVVIAALNKFHRTHMFLKGFAEELAKVPKVFIGPIIKGYGDDEKTITLVTAADLAREVNVLNGCAESLESDEDTAEAVCRLVKNKKAKHTAILCIGAGNAPRIAALLKSML